MKQSSPLEPDTHFQSVVGGYAAAKEKYGDEHAHWLWSFAKLYRRDKGKQTRPTEKSPKPQDLGDYWRDNYLRIWSLCSE